MQPTVGIRPPRAMVSVRRTMGMSRRRTSWSGEVGPLLRWFPRIIISPVLSLSLIGALICAFSLLSSAGNASFLGGLLLPWVALGLLLLSLPTVGALVSRYQLPEQTRRNHALEHGTLYFLRKRYGTRYKLSGRSEERGFRVAGARYPADIQRAFRELLLELRKGNQSVVVARRCGSNIVTAQACGLVLMAGLAVSVVALSPSIVVVVVAALGIIGIAAVARYPLGMMLQKRRFLLIDFSDASILSVDPVDRAEVLERHPVHFVRTQILRAASGEPPNNTMNPTGGGRRPPSSKVARSPAVHSAPLQ